MPCRSGKTNRGLSQSDHWRASAPKTRNRAGPTSRRQCTWLAAAAYGGSANKDGTVPVFPPRSGSVQAKRSSAIQRLIGTD